jgi:hypothetical protein
VHVGSDGDGLRGPADSLAVLDNVAATGDILERDLVSQGDGVAHRHRHGRRAIEEAYLKRVARTEIADGNRYRVASIVRNGSVGHRTLPGESWTVVSRSD